MRAKKLHQNHRPRFQIQLSDCRQNDQCRHARGQENCRRQGGLRSTFVIKEQAKTDELTYLTEALENVKPQMEVRSRRVGGASYQVPTPVRNERKQTLAIRWLVAAARDRSNSSYHSFAAKLAAEIIDAHAEIGNAIKKKLDTHRMADANRAFAHFRW